MTEPFRTFPDVVRHPVGGGAELVYGLLGRTAHLASPARVHALRRCMGFATLETHAARVAADLSIGVLQARADLDELVRAGLLVSASELVRRVRSGAPSEAPPITQVGIPTCGRVDDACAALASYADDARRHGRQLRYVVADGDDPGGRLPARLAELARERGLSVEYVGARERARFGEALAERAGVPLELVAFALRGDPRIADGTGANRNVLLLSAVGEASLQVDDDTRCRLFAPLDPRAGLALHSSDDATELWPFDASRAAVSEAPKPFVALHEELLGKSAAECAAARPQGLDLDGSTAMLFRRLEARGGRVLCTQSGGAGDSGTGTTAHLMLLEGASRARLLADEATYTRARTTRQILRVAARAALGDGAACMSMGLGLDARAVLPPFSPNLRDGEAIFSTTLRRTHDDALLGFVPWAVEHTPPEPRSEAVDVGIAAFTTLGANDVLRLLIAASRVEARRGDPGSSLRALGDVLVRWATSPPLDFDEIVRVQVLRARSLDLLLLGEARARHRSGPAFWLREVDAAIARLRAALPGRELARAVDLPGEGALQELVRRHGELLRAWPDLWEAAGELRAEGPRLAVPLELDGARALARTADYQGR